MGYGHEERGRRGGLSYTELGEFQRAADGVPAALARRALAAGFAVLRGQVEAERERGTDNAGAGRAASIRRAEAARRLGVSLRTVDSLLASGALRRVRLPGRRRAVGIVASSIDSLIGGAA